MRARRDGERTRCRERGARVEERHPRHGPALRGGGNRVDPAPTAGDAPTLGGRPGRRPRGEAAASTPRSRPASDRGAARQPPRRSQEARPRRRRPRRGRPPAGRSPGRPRRLRPRGGAGGAGEQGSTEGAALDTGEGCGVPGAGTEVASEALAAPRPQQLLEMAGHAPPRRQRPGGRPAGPALLARCPPGRAQRSLGLSPSSPASVREPRTSRRSRHGPSPRRGPGLPAGRTALEGGPPRPPVDPARPPAAIPLPPRRSARWPAWLRTRRGAPCAEHLPRGRGQLGAWARTSARGWPVRPAPEAPSDMRRHGESRAATAGHPRDASLVHLSGTHPLRGPGSLPGAPGPSLPPARS